MGIGIKGFGGTSGGIEGAKLLPPAAVEAKGIFQVPPPIPPAGGELWAWGFNKNGQLGPGYVSGSSVGISSPIQIGSLTDWASVDGGQYHSTAVKTDGTLWGWGKNDRGQVGDGTNVQKTSPVQVGALTDWASVSDGERFSTAVKTDGTLWTWGVNTWGQLGDGTQVTKSSPIQVGSLTDWASVSAARHTIIAIKTDGTLWAWGLNNTGQIGDSTQVNKSSPVQIGSLTNWRSCPISAGTEFSHAFGIKTDNTLWAWGQGSFGALGTGNNTSQSSPVQVGALTDWASVSAGKLFGVAVKIDGTLWSWGTNTSGQMGNTGPGTYSPVQIGALTDWASVNAGAEHVIARKTDGTLWSWGDYKLGILGQNQGGPDVKSPVQIGALTTWIKPEAGWIHSFGIKTTE